MILIEAQSTWTVNILVRVLLYLAQSYHEYFQRTCQNYYKSRKVKMPRPEIYVIFTGAREKKPDKISLSEEFFEGAEIDVEVKASVIYESNTDDIINQYIIFCKVFNEQTRQYGMTKKQLQRPSGLTLEEVGEIEAEIMQSALLIVLISLYENRFCINSFSYN